jgi:hypothetical protein
MKILIGLFLLTILGSALTAAQRRAPVTISPTIPEMVEHVRPGPLERYDFSESSTEPFDSAVRDTDLILQASLSKVNTYLSTDQRVLLTDYVAVPVTVFVGAPRLQAASGPIIVRVGGGETIINGVIVRMGIVDLLPLPTDRPLLLFLTFNKEVGKYEIYSGRAYAFDVDNTRHVHPLVRDSRVFPMLSGADIGDVVNEIHRRGR